MQKEKKIRIIYKDNYLVAVDKPSGLLVVPAPEQQNKDLTSLLNRQFKEQGSLGCVYPCHRLDRETTGVVLFALSENIQQAVMDQFRERSIHKKYMAFVQGCLKMANGTLKSYIQGAWPYNRNEQKKLAITKFKVLYHARDFSVVELEPVTGRTNQIRIQFRDLRHPLLGERRFAFARDWKVKFKRTALHSASIEFTHPVNNKKIFLTSPLPQDMNDFLEEHGITL